MPETTDYADECDYNALKKKIENILYRYFEYDDGGNPNEQYDPNFSAQDALDEIKEAVGGI